MACYRTEHEAMMKFRELAAAANAQEVLIVEVLLADGAAGFQPLRPLDLDRRDRKEKRSREIALAPDARLLERLFGGDIGQPFGKAGRGERLDIHKIDRTGHRRLQAVDRETRDGPDAGFARGQLRPV